MDTHLYHKRRLAIVISLFAFGLGVLTLAMNPPVARSASLVVNTLADETTTNGNCSLREAITNANNNAATFPDCIAGSGTVTDTITFSVNGTITISPTLPVILNAGALVIDGAGRNITISGNNLYRVFQTSRGANVTLQNLTIANGMVDGSAGTATPFGAGVYNDNAVLTLSNIIFSGNVVTSSGTLDVSGGGLFNGGTATLRNVTFSNNAAIQNGTGNGYGGAIYSDLEYILNITNTTFVSNTASTNGGALYNQSMLSIANSTFTGNSAAGAGGGLYNANEAFHLTNLTIAGNSASAGNGGGIYNFGIGFYSSVKNSIIANNTGGNCGGDAMTDDLGNLRWPATDTSCPATFTTGDPALGVLANNGSAGTQTLALGYTSAAIDIGNNANCAAAVGYSTYGAAGLDQRVQTRDDLQCDAGAYELKFTDSITVALAPTTATLRTYGPTRVGIQDNSPTTHPGVITVTKRTIWPNGQPTSTLSIWWSATAPVNTGVNLNVELCYSTTELRGLPENTLRLWRYNGFTWAQTGNVPTFSGVSPNRCALVTAVPEVYAWTLANSAPGPITSNPTLLPNFQDVNHKAITSSLIGLSAHDAITVTGPYGAATGNVTFTQFSTINCTGGSTAQPVALNASGFAESTPITVPITATSYLVSYGGDVNYFPMPGICQPLYAYTDTTTIHDPTHTPITSAFVGSSVHDNIVITGTASITPTGSVTFTTYSVTNCTGISTTQNVTLTNGVAESITTTVPATGLSYQVSYGGDTHYAPTVAMCEPLTPIKVTPNVTTNVHDPSHLPVTSAFIGSNVHDSAVVTGTAGITPTGNVTFTLYSAATNCTGAWSTQNVTLTNGAAESITTTVPNTGMSYQVNYSGDASYTPATGICEPLNQVKVASNVSTNVHDSTHNVIVSYPSGGLVHDSAVVTGTLSVTPTGSVTFTQYSAISCTGTTTQQNVNLLNGSAESNATSVPPGGLSYQVNYGGDINYSPSTGLCENLSSGKATPGMSASIRDASNNVVTSAFTGSSVHDLAVVSGGFGIPTGSVTFTLFTTATTCTGPSTTEVMALTQGSAQSSPATVPNTGMSYLASYPGDATYAPVAVACQPLTAVPVSTTVTLVNTPNPSVWGQSVALTATVNSGAVVSNIPSGTITFTEGATTLGVVALNASGVAAMNIVTFTVGAHPNITAAYSGDANFVASTSSPVTQTVNQANTTTARVSSVNPSVFGQSVSFTATVSANAPGVGAPTGTVQFQLDGANLGAPVALVGGVATNAPTATLTVGTHSVAALYSGDTHFVTSTGTLSQTVNKANTTTTLTSSPNPAVFGQSVTYTATVAAVTPGVGIPTGSVVFMDSTTVIGSSTLNASGVATLTYSALSSGGHTIVAYYGGDGNFNISDSNPAHSPNPNETVNKANSSLALTSAPNPSMFGQSVTITATASAVAPGIGVPSGTVTFTDGATVIGTAALNASGVASINVSTLAVGARSVTATYGGDSNFNGSTSPATTQTVNKANSTTTLTSAPSPSGFGQPVTLSAAVSAIAPGAGMPTGTVTFFDGVTNIGTSTLNASGVATMTVSSFSVGTHSLTATYTGDGSFNTSTSPAASQSVGTRGSVTALTNAPTPSVFGQPVIFTATVTAATPGTGTPSGTATFYDGALAMGTGTLNASGVATLTYSSLAVGTHSTMAVYNGDVNFTTSTSPSSPQTVNKANSATAVTSGPNPSVFGQTVTLTATVTAAAPGAGTPSGIVTFTEGATTLGTGTLNASGIATLNIASLAMGTHSISAVYAGDASFNTSTSTATTQTVNKANSATALTSGPNPSVFGQTVTLTATVTAAAPGAGTPSGIVTFTEGATTLGTGTLNASGIATLNYSAFAIGAHSITATYGGDGNFNASSAPAASQTVNKANSATALTTAPNPSAFGQSVTITATVTAAAPGAGTPGGIVTFTEGVTTLGTSALNASGVTTITVSSFAVGAHSLTATYGGDGNFNASTAPAATQTVAKSASATAVTTSPNPSVFGQAVTITATVTASGGGNGTPTGTVTFTEGATVLGTAALNASGAASINVSSFSVATHSITAAYSGDINFPSSTSPIATQTVNKANSATVVTTAPNPSVFGQSVTLTATVTAAAPGAGTPSGSVTFFDGATILGVSTLNASGIATLNYSAFAVGAHSITANYGGDGSFNTNTSPAATQTVAKSASSLALTSALNPSVFGQSVTITATASSVAPGIGVPSGTVTFTEGATVLGTATLNASGIATLNYSALAVGTHSLTATYGGDGNFNSSTAPAATQTVNKASSATTLTTAPNPSGFGQVITLTAAVNAVAPGVGMPTGTVTFTDGATTLGTGALNASGIATLAVSSLAVGTHNLTATYGGSGSFLTSASSPVAQSVGTQGSVTTLTNAPSTTVFGQPATFTVTVTPAPSGAGTPSGTVTFYDGALIMGTGTLNASGVATLNISSLAVGTHTVMAVYGGDGSFNTSTSSGVTQTVNKASSATALTSAPNPSVFGQTVTLTATVTPVAPSIAIPSGTVTFTEGATTLGVATLNASGIATLNISSFAVGAHSIAVAYIGDAGFNASASTAMTQTVNKASSATALTSAPNPSVFGQSVTITATVTAVAPGVGTPSGTVTFTDGVTNIGTGTLNASGIATLNIASLAVGAHNITATYNGDGSFNTNTSPTMTQTVNKASSATALTSAPNPSVFGQSVTLTATVTASGLGAGTPSGAVTFFDGATNIGTGTLDASGIATLNYSALAVGAHSITAQYGGSGSFLTSTSSAITQTVNKASSAIALTSAPNPSVFGQSITITATMTAVLPGAGTPSGTVTFFDGATNIGTGTLNASGIATLNIASLAVGAHSITATYNGDGSFLTSTSSAMTQTVNKASSATALTSAPNPSVFGQSVTLTATVTASGLGAGTPSGIVTFTEGATTLGTGALSGGIATMNIASLAVGAHNITATYGGDGSFNTNTSPAMTQTVNKASSATALTSAPNPSVFGQTVTLTATVTAVAPGAGMPSGAVTFFDGATNLGVSTLDASGIATLNYSALAVGAHNITAHYAGDGSFLTSTSSAAAQTVNKADTTTTLTNAPDPSVYGQPVTLTATVSAVLPGVGVPSGTVTFFEGATTLGTGTLNASGIATLSIPFNTVGTIISITAAYGGDGSFNTSTSSATTQTVNQASSATTVGSSANPSVFGQSVTFTATVTAVAPGAGTPSGTVQFQLDGVNLGTPVALVGGTATSTSVVTMSVGAHSVAVAYSGDTNFIASSGNLTQNVDEASSATALTSAPNPSVFGQSVTFTATVTAVSPGAGAPSGTVTFKDGATTLGTGTLDASGVTTFTYSTLSAGARSITAAYGGDGNFNTNTSSVLTQTVNQASTATALTNAPSTSVFGQSVTFTATVSAVLPGVGIPTGTVTFYDDVTSIGTGTLNASGIATLNISSLAVGTHISITADYTGDTNFLSSTSPAATQTVNQASSTTTVGSSANPSVFGQSVNFTATINPAAPGTGTPSGTVQFQLDGANLGTPVALVGGTATSTSVVTMSVGAHTVAVAYSGDTNFIASSGNLTQNVNKASSAIALTSSPNPSTFNQMVTYTATVTAVSPGAGIPSGTLTFHDGATLIANGALNASGQFTFTYSALAAGTHTIAAAYSGDGNFNSNTSNLTQTVNKADTTTALSTSVNPSVFGQAVMFTAHVTSTQGIPTGIVTFKDGATTLGTGALDATGTATYTLASLSVASHTITAQYGGDSNYNTSSMSGGQTVNQASSATALTNAPNPSRFGQMVTFTATVTAVSPGAGTPTGTVNFYNDTTSIGTGTLNASGVATLNISSLAAGTYVSITAQYAGSTDFLSSTSPAVTQTVNPANTTTSVASSQNPSTLWETIAFTATVSPVAPGAGTPSGTVQFKMDGFNFGSPVTLVGGKARSSDVVFMSVGNHTVSAVYSGDLNFNASSGMVNGGQIVNKVTPTVGVASLPSPSIYNQSVTFTATVASSVGTPTGVVTFTEGATTLGIGTLDASAVTTLTVPSFTAGLHHITAAYNGDANFYAVTSAYTQTVNKADTTTTVTPSVNPSVAGQPVIWTATVASTQGTPTGSVTFNDGATALGTGTLNASGVTSFTFALQNVGSHTITAHYNGDSNFNTSTGTQAGGQTVNPANTTTTLTPSQNPSSVGQAVVFTATVAGVAPSTGAPTSGTVTFTDGTTTTLGTGTVNGSGIATITVSSLSIGSHSIAAAFGGNGNYLSSASAPMTQTVNNLAPVITNLNQNSVNAQSSGGGGATSFKLMIYGTGFVNGSQVYWDTHAMPTTFVSSTQLQVAVSSSELTVARTVNVTVLNPAIDGGASNTVPFVIGSHNTFLPLIIR